ncbi:MAG: NAD(P)-dependent oxidoreductase [Pseudorhodoplanes sp.]|uniref:NAD(P)-dependent oxidoreductase n=1 Tax=Pseudorhodoplanes sp. TaxID=1934341 RepID=UPI003D147D0B
MRVGIAGLGKMGGAIAARLMECGHDLIVWNRSADKAAGLADAGAKVASSPADLAAQADAIVTILTDAAALDAVYDGPSGLLSADVTGKLFIEMSTVQPATEIALAGKVRAKGAAFVECPVGGTTGPARQGKLFGFAGGTDVDVARAKPLLDQMCRRLEHVGEVGAGAGTKLAINLPLMIYWQALGEALAISRHLKIEPQRMLDILADTSGAPAAVKNRGPNIAAWLAGGDFGAVTFNLDDARKDIRTMIAQGKAVGVDLPLIEKTLACFDEASAAGYGQGDGSGLAVYWARRNKA